MIAVCSEVAKKIRRMSPLNFISYILVNLRNCKNPWLYERISLDLRYGDITKT